MPQLVSSGLGSSGTAAWSSPLVRNAARVAHDLGLAAWFGGACMGAVGLNAATREVDDPTQRSRVANAGWFRWAPFTALSISGYLFGGLVLRRGPQGLRQFASRRSTPVADIVQSVLTLIALAATLESGRSGREMVRGGDVPVATAVQPISATPPEVAQAQRRLRVVQWVMPVAVGGILVVNALRTDRYRE